jgi:cytochrome P450
VSIQEREDTAREAQLQSAGLAAHYDHFAPEYVENPFALWRCLREEEPVARSEVYGGFYVVTRYEDIRSVAADPERFSSAQGAGLPEEPLAGLIPLNTDPPSHRRYRQIVNSPLRAAAVEKREDEIRQIAIELIEPLVGREEFEVSQELSMQLPPRATLGFIGFPREEWDEISDAVENIIRLRGSGGEVDRYRMVLVAAIQRLLQTRKAEGPQDRVIDLVMAGKFDDRPLSDEEIMSVIANVVFGAVDTTSLAITGVLHYLATHRDHQDRLREEGVSDTAAEELVRWTSPVQGLARTVTRDTELAGCPLKKGDKVLMMWASGNRDETAIPDPDTVDFGRDPNPHLGFGHGPHKCAGRHLGKLMLRVGVEEFLRRIGPYELADPEGIVWVGGESSGIRRLPLRPVVRSA